MNLALAGHNYLLFLWSMVLNLGYTHCNHLGMLNTAIKPWISLKSIKCKFLKVMSGTRFVLKISRDDSNAQLESGRSI